MAQHFPPKNYEMMEYPKHHFDSGTFELALVAGTKDATILPLLQSSDNGFDNGSDPTAIDVNPRNSGFGVTDEPICYNGSIVPDLKFWFSASLTEQAWDTDKVLSARLNYFPIYLSFLEDYHSVNQEDTTDIEAAISMQHNATEHAGYPVFGGDSADLDIKATTADTIGTTQYAFLGLTTNAILEGVALNMPGIYDNLKYGTNRKLLMNVIGKIRTARIGRESKPYRYRSGNRTYPKVKRMNDYTFCGMAFNVENSGKGAQPYHSTEITDTLSGIRINWGYAYTEWNPNFNQSAN